MPAARAASSREDPSSTSARASIRRAAGASRHRLASRRSSPAPGSFRVIATVMAPSADRPHRRSTASRATRLRARRRASNSDRWYKPLRALAAPANPTVAPIQHALVLGPRTRVVRNLLEVAHLRVELQDMLGAALSRARKQRDRPLVILLEAIASSSRDLADEVDSAGQAL